MKSKTEIAAIKDADGIYWKGQDGYYNDGYGTLLEETLLETGEVYAIRDSNNKTTVMKTKNEDKVIASLIRWYVVAVILFFAAIVLCVSCSKKQNPVFIDDMTRSMQVTVTTGPGIDQNGNASECWKIILTPSRAVNNPITARVKWYCNAVVGAGLVHYDESFTTSGSYTTHYQAHSSYKAEGVQLVTVSCPGYTFK